MFTERLATAASGLFTGASIYINLVEHPARMRCGTQLALTEFASKWSAARSGGASSTSTSRTVSRTGSSVCPAK